MPRQTVIICWPTDLALAGMDAAAVSSAAKVPASHSLPGGAFGAVPFSIATRRRHSPGHPFTKEQAHAAERRRGSPSQLSPSRVGYSCQLVGAPFFAGPHGPQARPRLAGLQGQRRGPRPLLIAAVHPAARPGHAARAGAVPAVSAHPVAASAAPKQGQPLRIAGRDVPGKDSSLFVTARRRFGVAGAFSASNLPRGRANGRSVVCSTQAPTCGSSLPNPVRAAVTSIPLFASASTRRTGT
jgi:hypothetical protein